MTTELTKAAQQALEALKHGVAQLNGIGIPLEAEPLHTAITALERALTQRPAAQEADWRTPTTYAQRFADAVALLCRESPPADMVAGWIDRASDDHRLQDWACERAPAWAQGIGLLDAAHVMADQPTEGVDHEPAPQQATPEPLTSEQQSALKQALFKSARVVEQATPEPVGEPALTRYKFLNIEGEESCPVGRLRGFLSIALSGQDWLDVEPFLDALTRPAPGVPEELRANVIEALREGLSVCMSVTMSRDRKIIRDGGTLYAQTEEWCRWLETEVGPQIRAVLDALAAAQAKGVV